MKKLLAVVLMLVVLMLSTAWGAKKQDFSLLTTPENELLVKFVQQYCDQNNINLKISYLGDIDCINELSANSSQYDAVWLSNSIWLYQLDSSVSVTDSKSTGIVPVVVGIKPARYSESIKTIDDLMQLGGKFGIPSITRSDSGASTFLGIYSALSGSPRMLTMEQVEDPEIGAKVTSYVSENSTIYSTYEELVELAGDDQYAYCYGYESDFIRLNKEFGMALKLIYLDDGVPLADKPFAYVDHKDSVKKEIFLNLQQYLLTSKIQKKMCQEGIRTGYGGLVPYAESDVFNPEWGIDTQQYLAPMNYPSKEVTTQLLNFYTESVSKPANYIFCLDYSGSMEGAGHEELVSAMTLLFEYDLASNYYIQMKDTDLVTIVIFTGIAEAGVKVQYSDFESIPEMLENIEPGGATDIYDALNEATKHVLPESDGYRNYVVLLTDGRSKEYDKGLFEQIYRNLQEPFPIYSITMGDADDSQLADLASLSGGKIFDGKTDLVSAFKTLRGYN